MENIADYLSHFLNQTCLMKGAVSGHFRKSITLDSWQLQMSDADRTSTLNVLNN